MRFRAAHLAIAGFVAECIFAVYAWFASPPQDTLEGVAHGIAILVMVVVSLVGLVPAFLLWRPQTHKAGRWSALILGWIGVLSVFWSIQGLFLVAAFVWAIWREKGPAVASAALAPPAPPTPPSAPPPHR